jgi:two-component system nitrogen regulation sensor histidine kinase NtrY
MTGELKKINSELEEGRRYIETILANVGAGVVAIGHTGRITTINRAAETMLGLRQGLRGESWEEVFQRPDLREVGRMIGRVAAGEEDEAEQQVKLSAGQRVVTALVTVTVLRDENAAAMGTMVFFEDVSHLRRAERMEAWREVARRIAHEIKNPLTPIQLSAQRLRKKYLAKLDAAEGEVFDECTRTIVRQVDELKRLVNEFASFARLPPADMRLHDLNEVVDEALVLYREAHRDIGFVFTPERNLPRIEIDREAVTRALINLLDNAVAACRTVGETQTPRIELATAYKERLGVVQVEVADNGAGIPPEMRPRLFEPYASTKKDGTGLGLAIVSAIAADHQAYVRVRDNEPRGTRFVIEFPLRRREEAPRVARA